MTKGGSKKGKKESAINEEALRIEVEAAEALVVVATLRSYLGREVYPSFINDVRAALARVALEGEGIYLLPVHKIIPKYIKVRILIDIDETQGIDVILLRSNAYAIAFAIMVGEGERGKYFWFEDQALSKKAETCNGIGFESNYGELRGTSGYKHIGDVGIGRDYVVEAYYRLTKYLHDKGNNKVIVTDNVRSQGARSLLTIILMVCEASRFDEIKRVIFDKYDNSYATLEEDGEPKRVQHRVLNWSSASSSSPDSDARLFQFTDWKMSLKVDKNKLKEIRDSASRTPDGYTMQNVISRDGNCQFRAIADQLGDEGTFNNVRQQIVQELRANPDEYMTIAACTSDKEYKAYVDEMSKNTEWGDAVTLVAAATALNLEIVLMVWSESQGTWGERRFRPRRGRHVDREIYVSFQDLHYSSLTPRPI